MLPGEFAPAILGLSFTMNNCKFIASYCSLATSVSGIECDPTPSLKYNRKSYNLKAYICNKVLSHRQINKISFAKMFYFGE